MSYQDFLDACDGEPTEVIEADDLSELLETGSLTVSVRGKSFVLSLNAEAL
jgi:hypothetical protein